MKNTSTSKGGNKGGGGSGKGSGGSGGRGGAGKGSGPETLEDGLVPPAILAVEVVPTTLLPSKVDGIQVPSPGLTNGTLTSFLSVCLFHIQII